VGWAENRFVELTLLRLTQPNLYFLSKRREGPGERAECARVSDAKKVAEMVCDGAEVDCAEVRGVSEREFVGKAPLCLTEPEM
jgi:hypothetical protein